LEVDLVQYDTGEGPCLEAIRKSDLVRLDVVDSATAYPHFAPGALDAGIETVLSVPAVWHGNVVGALNLYSKTSGAYRDENALTLGHTLATYAAESIVTSPLYATSLDLVEDVIETMGTAEVVGQAIDILRGRMG